MPAQRIMVLSARRFSAGAAGALSVRIPPRAKLRAQALALHNSGLQKMGYEYLILDDFWYQCPGPQGPNVDSYGRWITDSSKFPGQGDSDGMKVVADYIH